jgi:hypothetical protein
VRSHIARHGWQSYFASADEVNKRLELAAKYYRARWQDFIKDTSKPHPNWEKRNYSFTIGLKHLVRFLLLVGQKDLAVKYTSTLVALLVDEIQDQPIPEIKWLR